AREAPETPPHVMTRPVHITSAVLALIAAPPSAQGMQPAKPAPVTPPPAAAAPVKPVTTTGAATNQVAAKTNLNTATVAELDKLPQIGPTRSKAIVEARAKAKFKDWNDFVARKVVPADVVASLKDIATF